MVYASLPSRPPTTRWRRAGDRAIAFMDGLRWILGLALLIDAVRSLAAHEPSILAGFLRWPGGRPLPAWDGAVLGMAFLLRRRPAALVLSAHALLAGLNIGEFYLLRSQGLAAAALPFSVVTLALLIGAISRTFYEGPAGPWAWRAAGAALAAPALLLLYLLSFGATDYTRPADAIVVFGARVYADGEPSLALEDRVLHGARLYHQGIAPRLVLSGAPDEVQAMLRLALAARVPAAAIGCDPEGLNTRATVANLRERRIVAVSHYYHLARIKLAASRRGIVCATAPCRMSKHLAREPYFLVRECAALLSYYLGRA